MSKGTLNKVMLIGNLGRDPEVKDANGLKIVRFSIATSEKKKDKEDLVEWHNCVVFGKLAEICEKYLVKGSKVYLEGRLQTSKWADKETGKDKYKTEIIADHLVMLGGSNKKESSNDSQLSIDDAIKKSEEFFKQEDVPF